VEAVEEEGRCVDLGKAVVRVARDWTGKEGTRNLAGSRHRGKSSRTTTTPSIEVRILSSFGESIRPD